MSVTDKQREEILDACRIPVKDNPEVQVDGDSNKCLLCEKWYRYPSVAVFKPRHMICFSCETIIRENPKTFL